MGSRSGCLEVFLATHGDGSGPDGEHCCLPVAGQEHEHDLALQLLDAHGNHREGAPDRLESRAASCQQKCVSAYGTMLNVSCGSCVTMRSRSKRLRATVLEMEVGPPGSAIRSLIPSHRERLWSKAKVANVAETLGR